MSDLIKTGLEISVLGMGLTFASLGLLILAMVLLERLFRVKVAEVVVNTAVTPPYEPADAEITAAIAAALTHWQMSEQNALGDNLQKPPGPWWHIHGNEQ